MKTYVEKTSNEKQRSTERLKEDLFNLQNCLRGFQDDLSRTEEMFEDTKEDIKFIQSRADRNHKFVKTESAKQVKVLKKVAELERLVKNNEADPQEEQIPYAGNSWRKNTTFLRRIGLFKISCVAVMETVAAYTLFRVTKPLFF